MRPPVLAPPSDRVPVWVEERMRAEEIAERQREEAQQRRIGDLLDSYGFTERLDRAHLARVLRARRQR